MQFPWLPSTVDSVISPILQMRKLRTKEARQFAQSHPGSKWKTPNSSPESDVGNLGDLSTVVLIDSLLESGGEALASALILQRRLREVQWFTQRYPALAGMFKWVFMTASDSEPSCTLGQVTYFFFYLLIYKMGLIILFLVYLFLIEGYLQYCVGSCRISTWINLRYTYVPSLLSLPPASHPISPL